MQTETLTIPNPLGLHVRAASLLAKVAGRYQASISLQCKNKSVNAKSILALLSLGAKMGEEIILTIEGPDEEEASQTLIALVHDGFGEL